jgi:hypothetical protein
MTHINPDDLKRYRFFNAAFAGANPEEIARFVDLYVRSEKLVVLGIDAFMIDRHNPPAPRENFQAESLREKLEYLFSLKVLLSSFRSFWLWASGHPPLISDRGFLDDLEFDRAEAQVAGHDLPRAVYEIERVLQRYEPSSDRLNELKRVKALLEARRIPYLTIFVPFAIPMNDYVGSHAAAARVGEASKALMQLFPDAVVLTNGRYSAIENFFKLDLHHFRPEVGAAFVNEALERRGLITERGG